MQTTGNRVYCAGQSVDVLLQPPLTRRERFKALVEKQVVLFQGSDAQWNENSR